MREAPGEPLHRLPGADLVYIPGHTHLGDQTIAEVGPGDILTIDLEGVPVRTLSIEGLLKTKQTVREKDKLAVAALAGGGAHGPGPVDKPQGRRLGGGRQGPCRGVPPRPRQEPCWGNLPNASRASHP